ncbi:metallophosphoesterase family protein [Parvularcula dongshanensis]|uniref:DNA repair exonuclease SbcCD nuclease subunit n=1 Tax=Parvularcula dongshanensis TaxID=1173995 RepID=A0A840I0C0_9PROT|nr:metallophosphoesterase [Parvularcula dongshanensis]MBB4658147.1 DNA repair exonuclease SbcCD nuclease subunit [Parvularcula dongshanensis]
MGAFRFVHTADWQLGKPFGRFPAERAAQLRAARIDAIGRIAGVARDHGAGHVVVAGDVWDCEQPLPETIAQPLDAMASASDLVWWLLPGNHDPAARGGLWDRMRERGLPSNVRCLCAAGPVEAAPGAYLLPAPWVSKNPGRDLTEDFAGHSTPDGALRLGLAHGGTTEFRQDTEQSAAIAAGAASRGGLDYLALGDWHGHKRVDARTWFAGTPEPDSFPRNEPGYVLVVEAAPGREPVVTPVAVAQYHWSRDTLDLTEGLDPVARFEALHEGGPERRFRLAKLTVTGTARLHDRAALLSHLEGRTASYAHLDWDVEGLRTLIEADGLDRLDREGSLRQAAERLHARSINAQLGEADRGTARLALDMLVTLAADTVAADA